MGTSWNLRDENGSENHPWSMSSTNKNGESFPSSEPLFTSVFNFRRPTTELPVFRNAALDHTSKEDYAKFLSYTGIVYRIDLRSALEKFRSEHERPIAIPAKRHFLAKRISAKETGIKDNSIAKATAKHIHLTEVFASVRKKRAERESLVSRQTTFSQGRKVETFNVNFLNARYRNHVIWQRCTAYEKIKIFSYMITFQYKVLIRFIGEKIVSAGGLEGSYRDFLDYSDEAIGTALRLITESLEKREGAVGWNCFAGKDRTGLVTALLKYVIGDDLEDIIADYAKSDVGLAPIMGEMVTEFAKQGLPEEFARSPRTVMENTLAYLVHKYGSIESYLDEIGFDGTWRNRLNDCKY